VPKKTELDPLPSIGALTQASVEIYADPDPCLSAVTDGELKGRLVKREALPQTGDPYAGQHSVPHPGVIITARGRITP
jgi:hypothetical protein